MTSKQWTLGRAQGKAPVRAGCPMITAASSRLSWGRAFRNQLPMAAKASILLLAILLLGTPAQAAPPPPAPVHWQATPPPHTFKPGQKFDLQLTAKIDPGWHLYALTEPENGPIATEINLTEGDPATLLRTTQSKPRTFQDPVFNQSVTLFESSATFTLHLQAAPTIPANSHSLHVLIRYQSCNDHVCLPPHTDTVEVPF